MVSLAVLATRDMQMKRYLLIGTIGAGLPVAAGWLLWRKADTDFGADWLAEARAEEWLQRIREASGA